MKMYVGEGKTEELAKQKALEEAIASEKEVFLKLEEMKGSLLKKTKYKAYVITKQEIKDELNNYINELSKFMGIKMKSTIEEEDSIYKVFLDSDNNSILIGKDGRTLKAIQLLLRQYINIQTGFNIKINVDVSDYKEKKLKILENTIKKIAREVIHSKIEVKLDPMNSYERRFIHNLINNYTMLETKSEGEEPNRCIVISYKQD